MSFTKRVILAVLIYLVLPLAKTYIETNYLYKPSAYEAQHVGGKPNGEPVSR